MERQEAGRADKTSPPKTGTFTGEVWGEAKLSAPDVMMNAVLFSPRARTHWHSHEKGQILSITAGQGFVGNRDGQVMKVSPGDVIWTGPGEEHYHGATNDAFLLHDAVSLGGIDWLDEVPDAEYGEGPQ